MECYGKKKLRGIQLLKIFLSPLWIIGSFIILITLGIASDVAQLTNFNVINFITKHAPQPYGYIGLFIFILIIIELVGNDFQCTNNSTDENTPISNFSQSINTREWQSFL